jgi:hypothetical protein
VIALFIHIKLLNSRFSHLYSYLLNKFRIVESFHSKHYSSDEILKQNWKNIDLILHQPKRSDGVQMECCIQGAEGRGAVYVIGQSAGP